MRSAVTLVAALWAARPDRSWWGKQRRGRSVGHGRQAIEHSGCVGVALTHAVAGREAVTRSRLRRAP